MFSRLTIGAFAALVAVAAGLVIANWGHGQPPAQAPAGESAAPSSVPLPALGDPAFAGIAEPIGFTPVKGSSLPVRDGDEEQFSPQTKTVPVEVYRDEDFQSLLYVSKTGSVAALPYRKNFELRTLSSDGNFSVVRFSPTTGISWQLQELTWKPIVETGDIPIGDYDVQFMPSKDGFTVLRLDRYSGQVWFLNAADKWQLTGETPVIVGEDDAPAPATPKPPMPIKRPPPPPPASKE